MDNQSPPPSDSPWHIYVKPSETQPRWRWIPPSARPVRRGDPRVDFRLRTAMGRLNYLLAEQARKKEIAYACRIDPDVPDRLKGDWIRLRQVLINLIGNAVQFTSYGQVGVGVSLADRTKTRATLCFTISDTGRGIPNDRLEAIFEVFEQNEVARYRYLDLFGRGLPLTARLADTLDGHLFTQSREGEGTAVHFTVDLELSSRKGR